MGTEASIDIATRISGATTDIATRVTGAIRDAARVTGAGFDYLLNTALRESNLNPNARASGSSATGLFQFIDQTWLATMKQSGGALGYGKYADAISQTASGRYTVADPAMRDQIFALRKDPTANSLMAGAFANSNAKVLTDRLGRKPSDGELYMAHFLGASGASRLIRAAEANPNGQAAAYFPRAAGANASIFYDKSGAARSLKQVYAGLVGRHDVIGAAATRLAAAKPSAPTAPAPSQVSAIADNTSIATTPAVAAINSAVALPATAQSAPAVSAVDAPATFAERVAMTQPAVQPAVYARETTPAPMFQTLYQPDQRGPVAPVVRELWGARHAAAVDTADAVAPVSDISAQGGSRPALNAPLDLFQFLRPSARRPA
jgi:hypothetical protein